jgi:hypothetical protein
MITLPDLCLCFCCAVLSVDVQDVMGTHVVDVHGKLYKSRLDPEGVLKVDKSGAPLEPGTLPFIVSVAFTS